MRESGKEEESCNEGEDEEENHQEEEIGAIPYKVAGKELRGKGVRKGGKEEESGKEDEG